MKSMRINIPAPVITVIADVVSSRETHESLNSLYRAAGAPGDPPEGSKRVKALEWLRRTNRDQSVDPMMILGKLIEDCIDTPSADKWDNEARKKILDILGHCKIQYTQGGKLESALLKLGASSRSLEIMLMEFEYAAVDNEFLRALKNVDSNPREAISAASNILESFCKVYITDSGLEMPSKQDLKSVWAIVRKHLGFDPKIVVDCDLQAILTGLFATVEGIGSLRTHASSAHGAGKNSYRIEPRHARLAIHAAHSIVLFALETWDKRKNKNTGN